MIDFVKAMMDKFGDSSFGFKIDQTRMHAVGFSSGGFMASRMAFSYPGLFKSLTSLGGGYYNCLLSCPEDYEDSIHLPLIKNHPPTQLLHGRYDDIVPYEWSENYNENLKANSDVETNVVISNDGHTWIENSENLCLDWIHKHN